MTQITLTVWGAITMVALSVYVFYAWRWTPIDAEYELRPDYRLAFFVIGPFPRLIMLLTGTLFIEWVVANLRFDKRSTSAAKNQ